MSTVNTGKSAMRRWVRSLYCVVFVRRGEVFRIISLRKANDREVEAYEKGQTN